MYHPRLLCSSRPYQQQKSINWLYRQQCDTCDCAIHLKICSLHACLIYWCQIWNTIYCCCAALITPSTDDYTVTKLHLLHYSSSHDHLLLSALDNSKSHIRDSLTLGDILLLYYPFFLRTISNRAILSYYFPYFCDRVISHYVYSSFQITWYRGYY
jgi:hypothetical protein